MPTAAPTSPRFPVRVAFASTDHAGLLVVDVLTERGPLALRTTHRPGTAGWAEWMAMALTTLERWADDLTEVECRVRIDLGGRRCELSDGVRKIALDLVVAPARAQLPGVVVATAHPAHEGRRRSSGFPTP